MHAAIASISATRHFRGRGFQRREASVLQLLEQLGNGRLADSGGRPVLRATALFIVWSIAWRRHLGRKWKLEQLTAHGPKQ
jgi:hypothetical protein